MRETPYGPLYVAAQALDTPNVKITEGQPFHVQTKEYIRALAPAFGVLDADALAFTELPYLRIINLAEARRPPSRI
jgi:hypothetical protein